MSGNALKILAVGLDAEVKNQLSGLFKSFVLEDVPTESAWNGITEVSNDARQDIILCGSVQIGVDANEMAQVFRALCPNTPLFYVTHQLVNFQAKNFTKNGFQQAYLLPRDNVLFSETMANLEKSKRGDSRKLFKGVALVDVGPGDPLGFDVSIFLPINRRYIKVLNEGRALSDKTIEKFKNYEVSKVFIDADKVQDFYKYSAERLKALNDPQSSMSQTERHDRLNNSIRRIFMSVFDSSTDANFADGKETLQDTQNIVSEMIGLNTVHGIHAELNSMLKTQAENADRSMRVSTLAALFEMSLGLKQTQQAAIAGLFLDIGISTLPLELQTKPIRDMTKDELALYFTHPAVSLRLLQDRKMVITPEIQNAILHHHERQDGSGYPAKVLGHKISPLSQVVALADRFDELTFGPERIFKGDLETVFLQLDKEKICGHGLFGTIRSLVMNGKKAA